MVRKTEEETGAMVYYCEICGFGYAKKKIADECEGCCSEHSSCSLEIIAKSIRRPT